LSRQARHAFRHAALSSVKKTGVRDTKPSCCLRRIGLFRSRWIWQAMIGAASIHLA
jgi:hypothetical protein